MNVVIRAATDADVAELARLRWQLYTERESHEEPFPAYAERFTVFAHDALARDDWWAWVGDDGNRLVAAVWLHAVPRVPAPGHGDPRPMGYLTNMYVEPDLRARGVGSQLVRELIGHCETAGFELILTFPADDAFGFYEVHGFERRPDPVVLRLGRIA